MIVATQNELNVETYIHPRIPNVQYPIIYVNIYNGYTPASRYMHEIVINVSQRLFNFLNFFEVISAANTKKLPKIPKITIMIPTMAARILELGCRGSCRCRKLVFAIVAVELIIALPSKSNNLKEH